MSAAARILLRAFALGWIFGGMSYFYLVADFDYNPFSLSDSDYYFWDKASMVLVLLCLLFPFRRMKYEFYVLLSFCIVRMIYELPYFRNIFHLSVNAMFIIWCTHVVAVILVAAIFGIVNNYKTYIRETDAYFKELYKKPEKIIKDETIQEG